MGKSKVTTIDKTKGVTQKDAREKAKTSVSTVFTARGCVKSVKNNNTFDKSGASTATTTIVLEFPYTERIGVEAAKLMADDSINMQISVYSAIGYMRSSVNKPGLNKEGMPDPKMVMTLETQFNPIDAGSLASLIETEELSVNIGKLQVEAF